MPERVVPLVAVALMLIPLLAMSAIAADDLQAARDEINRIAGNLESISFRSTEVVSPVEGERRTESYRFSHARGGKYAVSIDRKKADAPEFRIFQMHEDGKARFQPNHSSSGADRGKVLYLQVDAQRSSDEHYFGVMGRAIWSIFPCGESITSLIDEDAELSFEEEAGHRVLMVKTRCHGLRGNRITLRLRPDRDYAVEEVVSETETSRMRLRTTEFRQFGGRWFPVAGEEIAESTRGPEPGRKATFTVDKLTYNEPLPPETFGPPEVPAGTPVRDSRARLNRVR